MRLVRYADPMDMLRWAEDRIPVLFRQDAKAIGLEQDGELIAVTVFDTFSSTDCQMHVAAVQGRFWLTRDYAKHVAVYAFHTAKMKRIQCIISVRNDAAIRFATHMGCQLEGRFREAGQDGEDELSFGLLRRECKWLPRMGLGPLANSR